MTIETDEALFFAGTNQLPNESLKSDPGRDLRSVRRDFIEEAAAIVIVIEIAEADLGIDSSGDVTAERGRGLHGDPGTDVKTTNVCPGGHIKSFRQIVAATDAEIRIDPTFGETEAAIEFFVQDLSDFLLRRHRVLPCCHDEF